MDREVVVEGIYQDFLGEKYVVIAESESSDNMNKMVVYHKVGDNSYTAIDEREDFLAEVEDGVENVTGQKYKFELVEEGLNR